MQVVILCGGKGTRLREKTELVPKPMVRIGGKPILWHIMNIYSAYGFNEFVLCVGYLGDKIKDYFGDGSKFGVKISYSVEEEPLGTGGAVKQAAENIKEPFILVWGDNLTDVNIDELLKTHKENKAEITMTLTPREDVEHFGVAKLEGNKIMYFVEKPSRQEAPSNLINAGVFVIDPKALEILPQGKSSIEKDCFEKLAKKGIVYAYIHKGKWFPTDTIEKYKKADREFNL